MRLAEFRLQEAKSYSVEIPRLVLGGPRYDDVEVYENPSRRDMPVICQKHFAMSGDSNLRGFLHRGRAYVWPAEEATHTTMQRALGLETSDGYRFFDSPEVANFHVRGYGWQEGDPTPERNQIIPRNPGDETLLEPLRVRWGCTFGGDGYY